MYMDIFTKEPANERPHVHFSRSANHKPNSVKIWLQPTVKLDKQSDVDDYTVRELREMLTFTKRNCDILLSHWRHLHGNKKRRGNKCAK